MGRGDNKKKDGTMEVGKRKKKPNKRRRREGTTERMIPVQMHITMGHEDIRLDQENRPIEISATGVLEWSQTAEEKKSMWQKN